MQGSLSLQRPPTPGGTRLLGRHYLSHPASVALSCRKCTRAICAEAAISAAIGRTDSWRNHWWLAWMEAALNNQYTKQKPVASEVFVAVQH